MYNWSVMSTLVCKMYMHVHKIVFFDFNILIHKGIQVSILCDQENNTVIVG